MLGKDGITGRRVVTCAGLSLLVESAIFMLSICAIVGCCDLESSVTSQSSLREVSGRIVDDNLTPLGEVVVSIDSVAVSGERMRGLNITNADGFFRFSAPQSIARSRIEVYASQFASGRSLEVAGGAAIGHVVVLRYGSISGRLPSDRQISSVEIEIPHANPDVTFAWMSQLAFFEEMFVELGEVPTGVGIAGQDTLRRSVNEFVRKSFKFESIPSGCHFVTLRFYDRTASIIFEKVYSDIEVRPGSNTELNGE